MEGGELQVAAGSTTGVSRGNPSLDEDGEGGVGRVRDARGFGARGCPVRPRSTSTSPRLPARGLVRRYSWPNGPWFAGRPEARVAGMRLNGPCQAHGTSRAVPGPRGMSFFLFFILFLNTPKDQK